MTFNDDDDLDIEVSEAFAALDKYQPIDTAPDLLVRVVQAPVETLGDTSANVSAFPTSQSSSRGGRVFALAAAAALVVALAGYFLSQGDPTVVAAGNTSDNGTSSAGLDVDDDDTRDESEAEANPTTTVTSTTQGDESTSSVQSTEAAETTEVPTTEGAAEATAAPATTAGAPDTTSAPTTTEAPADTVSPESERQIVSGQVTEIMTDCVSHIVLGADGQPQDAGPVVCDGGSYLIIGGVKVVTSSGFIPGPGYDRHPRALTVGDVVEYMTVRDPESGLLTLSCDMCGPV